MQLFHASVAEALQELSEIVAVVEELTAHREGGGDASGGPREDERQDRSEVAQGDELPQAHTSPVRGAIVAMHEDQRRGHLSTCSAQPAVCSKVLHLQGGQLYQNKELQQEKERLLKITSSKNSFSFETDLQGKCRLL